MIEGIKIDMETETLRRHVQERADFHKAKSRWYDKQVDSLKAGIAAQTNVSNDPVSSLERSRESHRERATFFQIICDHLVPNEVYRLSEGDLARLELFSRYFV
mgnify:CR=1 FL=1